MHESVAEGKPLSTASVALSIIDVQLSFSGRKL
jgi:hypothetical protein